MLLRELLHGMVETNMPRFRLETMLDQDSARYSLLVYYPADATQPFARSPAKFATEADALAFARDMFENKLHRSFEVQAS